MCGPQGLGRHRHRPACPASTILSGGGVACDERTTVAVSDLSSTLKMRAFGYAVGIEAGALDVSNLSRSRRLRGDSHGLVSARCGRSSLTAAVCLRRSESARAQGGMGCAFQRTPSTSSAEGGGRPSPEVKEEDRAQPGPGDMEGKGARRPRPARSTRAVAGMKSSCPEAPKPTGRNH